ncbi:MAG: hypothetical protein WC413_01800 [Candidatus Nanoarchaeia archaeon]
MKFNNKGAILILIFVFITSSILYSESSIAAIYRVNSTSTDYTDLESCLKAINNSEQNTCKIDEPGVYTINKSYYNITGTVESNLNENYGIVYASVSNITVDFNGTVFVPYNGTESTGQTVFFSRASTNSIGDQSFSIINISFKNVNTTASDGFGYAGYFGKKGGTGFYQGINFLDIYNVQGVIFILASNNTLVVNHTGNITSYTGSGCLDQVDVFNQWTINFTIINSTGDLLSLCRPKFGALSIVNYIGKEVIMELAGNNGGFINNVTLSGQLAHGATNISIYNASTTYTHVGQGNYFNNVTITNPSSGCLGISVKLLALNALIEGSRFYCNGSTDGVILPLISNITIRNSWFNNSDNLSNCITLNGDNIHLENNTFENCGAVDYTVNEAWTLNQSWYASNSSFKYGGTNYNSCVVLVNGAAGHEHITHDNMPMTDTDGIVNYALWLLTDGGNAVGCGAGAKVTAYTANDYPLTCDALHVAAPAITCDYNSSWLFVAEGDGLSYGINYTNISLEGATLISGYSSPTLNYVNTSYYVNNSAFHQDHYSILGDNSSNMNITLSGNTFNNNPSLFFSINITSPNAYLWYNNFYSGVYAPTATGCYNNIGNFYKNITANFIANGECGIANITNSLGLNNISTSQYTLSWSNQSSYNDILYYLYFSNNSGIDWNLINQTRNLTYSWDLTGLANLATYKLKLVAANYITNNTGKETSLFTFNTQGSSISLNPATEVNQKLFDTMTLSCSAGDEINVSSLELIFGGTTICSGITSCSVDYKLNELGDLSLICYVRNTAGGLFSQATTIFVRSSSSTSSSGISGSSSMEITEKEIKENFGNIQEALDISQEPKIVDLSIKEIRNFKYDNMLTHTLIIDNINLEKGTISFTLDNKISSTIESGISKEIDIDGDGKKDIKVKLNKILLNNIQLTLERLVSVTTSSELEEKTQVKKVYLLWLWVGLIFIFFGISYYTLKKLKHKL